MPTEIRYFPKPLDWLIYGVLVAMLSIPAAAQPFQCANNSGVAPVVRAEGSAELMGDLVLDCTNGIPTPPNQTVPAVNIVVNLDTNISGRITAVVNSVQFLEALLIVDEPATQINPTVPILNCGNTSTPDNTAAGPGVCPVLGGGASGAAATYNGTAGHPNVFQGRSLAIITGQQNQVIFASVPIDPPGTVCPNQATEPLCHRIIRITNIRGNAALFGVSGETMPVQAHLIVNPVSGLPIDIPDSTVARIQHGLLSTVGTSSVHLQEAYIDAWKPKNISMSLTNGSVLPIYTYNGFGTSYPDDAAQNDVEVTYETESGFQWQNNSPNGPPSPNPPFGGNVSNVGNPLHSAGVSDTGISSAGVANAGSRVAIRFGNLPPGASVRVPQVVKLFNVLSSVNTGVMVLTNADSAGAGPFTPASGTLTASSNLAVYEVLFASPNALEYADVPFTLLGAPPESLQVMTVFAPFYSGAGTNQASSTYPVPRFAVLPVGIDIKPGAFPNTINLKSGGFVQVAILSTSSFDAQTLNPLTISLAGASVKVKGQGDPMISAQDVNGDGLLDLVVRINIDELQISATDTQATLTGETFEGQLVRGVDSVKVVH